MGPIKAWTRIVQDLSRDHVQDANLKRQMVQQERRPVQERESLEDEAADTPNFP
jgi:hypothetical protein